jgi:high affinity Mn2+ porin
MLAVAGGFDPAAGADALAQPGSAATPADWTGFYLGGHAEFALGHANTTVRDTQSSTASRQFGTSKGGMQAGYNVMLSARLVLGLEADVTFPYYLDSSGFIANISTGSGQITEHMDYHGTFRGRIGYAPNQWMVYGTGGLAFIGSTFLLQPPGNADAEQTLRMRTGWAAGAGVEYALNPSWTARFEYLYSRFGDTTVHFRSGVDYTANLDLHQWRVGLNWKIGDPKQWSATPGANLSDSSRWEIHGQTTYIQQGYPAFRSPYYGTNSFTPWAQTRETWTISAFVGVRLWDGGELYYNPDLLQGFGLHDTTGAAGFPNGEAQKSDFPYPHYSASHLFLRQTFGLGGEQETLESAANQLSSKVDVSRVTVQVGRFPVTDMFDGNAYARDPRKDFMNWSIWAAGAFDYPADKIGGGYGAAAELNQKNWALRGGYFLIDSQSNSNNFDMSLFRRGGYILELESRYSLGSHPGKLRTIGWLNSDYSGSYRETLDNPSLNLDIALTRRGRIKYGYVLNVEQSVSDDIGLFGRWSWNDGKNEIMAFTDIDASLSFGTSIKGTRWGRPDDTIGIGAAINALSRDHRDFIAAGGLGVLIGDGRLNYRPERVLENYYSLNIVSGTTLTFDYQLLTNPGYNADRGPVSVFSARLHAEF